MSGQAISDGVQVEKVIEDLIQRLSSRETTPAVKATLIEARRLKNVTNRWAAIPPPPDARREMMTRVMELVAQAGGSGALSMPPPAPAPQSSPTKAEPPPHSDPGPRGSPATQRSNPLELDTLSLRAPPIVDPVPASPRTPSPAEVRPPARKNSPAVRANRPATLPGVKPVSPVDGAEARAQAEAARRERARFSTEPPPSHNVPAPTPVDPFVDGEEVGFGSSSRGRTLSLGSKGITDSLVALADAKVPRMPSDPQIKGAAFEDPPTNQEPAAARKRSAPGIAVAARPASSVAIAAAGAQGLGRAVIAPGITIVRPDAAQWQPHPTAKGVTMKILHRDAAAGTFTALLKLGPGGALPKRKHKAAQEWLLTVGVAKVGAHDLRMGQYCRFEADTEHEPITSASGCTFFVSGAESDELPGDA